MPIILSLLINIFLTFQICLIFICMSVLSVRVSHVYLVSTEVRRGCCISWNQSYSQLCHVSTGTQTRVLRKSRKCSEALSNLSGLQKCLLFGLWFCLICVLSLVVQNLLGMCKGLCSTLSTAKQNSIKIKTTLLVQKQSLSYDRIFNQKQAFSSSLKRDIFTFNLALFLFKLFFCFFLHQRLTMWLPTNYVAQASLELLQPTVSEYQDFRNLYHAWQNSMF